MNSKAKKGFTLAEVLITLAIIGVVAAMSIPSLINKTNNAQYVTALKKATSVFNEATKRYMADNGCIGQINCQGIFDGTNDLKFYNAMKPYFNISKDCGGAIDEDCWADDTKFLTGNIDTTPSTNGNWDTWRNTNGAGKAILTDGMSVIFDNGANDGCVYNWGDNDLTQSCGWFYVDVNGKKGPNTWGRDTFWLDVTHVGRVIPRGTSLYSDASNYRWDDQSDSKYTCDPENFAESRGRSCAGRIAEQGWAMNY